MREEKAKRGLFMHSLWEALTGEKGGRGVEERVEKLFPDISHREVYENLSGTLREEIIKAGEEAAGVPWPALYLSDYRAFCQSGDRAAFEEKYFSRSLKLSTLVMAELMEDHGRFLGDILDGLFLLLGEDSWCLPAHNAYVRDTPQFPIPDKSRPVIDLFAAETGAIVAMTEYLLRPRFIKIGEAISRSVDKELEERLHRPFEREHFW
ncbi:MAG: hypothetical protein IIZ39_09910, partial [Blautia sp.]|nr:hypothetical protein [Blautia sp.]